MNKTVLFYSFKWSLFTTKNHPTIIQVLVLLLLDLYKIYKGNVSVKSHSFSLIQMTKTQQVLIT